MNDFITLERTSPDFQNYLLGQVSADFRAIPIRSHNINSASEKVTFQLVKTEDIARPYILKVLAQLFRLDLLTLTLMPGIVTACLLADQIENSFHVFWALVALFFLHGAICSRNDFLDHMSGVDRLNEKGGSRVIQNAWLRALTVQKLYFIMLAIFVSLAVPIIIAQPKFLILSSLPLSIYLMGLYFAVLTFAYVQARHIISMMVDHEAGILTLPVRLGFDCAKKSILFTFALSAAILCFYFASFTSDYAAVLTAVPLLAWIFLLAKKCRAVSSPLSSILYSLPQKIIQLHFVSGLYFIAVSWVWS